MEIYYIEYNEFQNGIIMLTNPFYQCFLTFELMSIKQTFYFTYIIIANREKKSEFNKLFKTMVRTTELSVATWSAMEAKLQTAFKIKKHC